MFVPSEQSTLIFLGCCFFFGNIEYSIILPSILAYIEQLEPGASAVWLGACVAAVPASGLLTSFIYGWYLDRFQIYPAILVSLLLRVIGSVYYSLATSPLHVVLARAICGCGNLQIISYTYIGVSSLNDTDRSVWAAKIGAVSKLGMLLAPALQVGLDYVNFKVRLFGDVEIHVTELNSPGWLLALFFLLLLCALPFFYFEPRRSRRRFPAATEKTALLINEDVGGAAEKRDAKILSVPLIGLAITKLISQYFQMTIETMVTPITNRVYHFTPLKNAYFYAGSGFCALVAFVVIVIASKKTVADRSLIWCGIVSMGVGIFVILGSWWNTAHAPPLWQGLLVPGVLIVFGLPFTWSPVSSLAMKVTGKRQAGAQAVLSAVTNFSSITAPLVTGALLHASAHLKQLSIILSALWIVLAMSLAITTPHLNPSNFVAKEPLAR